MQTVAIDHYRAYKPRPFTKAERKDTTILFGGLHWRAEQLLKANFDNMGYKAEILPGATKEDLLTGRELADIGQCCPTSFVTGNLANFLRDKAERMGKAEVESKYIHLTAGSCGSCRFGQYHQSYELALRNLGMESFRMFLMDQDQLDQDAARGDGLEINLPFTLGAVWALLCSDVVQDLEYQTRPYETEAGRTDAAVRESIAYLSELFRNRPRLGKKWRPLVWHLTTDYFVAALARVREKFAAIDVDRLQVKPIVKITGEFYLQTVEGAPNYDIHRWLESEGAEVYPAAVAVWLDYLMRLAIQELRDRVSIKPSARLKSVALRTVQCIYRHAYDRLRHALGDLPHELPDQYELRRLAAPFFHHSLSGGEGDMLVGKALWAHTHKKAHMICELSPYACMPNTMSVGAMAGVIGKYPDLLYAPLEIKGDAEVHALSRCQMILTEAKRRAHNEFEEALRTTGLTLEESRAFVAEHREIKSATYRIPRYGAAATAANLLLHIAEMKR
jgi:predicted nucleotide-binding protein (sugar kinase/HSP70/actin superfamily)